MQIREGAYFQAFVLPSHFWLLLLPFLFQMFSPNIFFFSNKRKKKHIEKKNHREKKNVEKGGNLPLFKQKKRKKNIKKGGSLPLVKQKKGKKKKKKPQKKKIIEKKKKCI